MFYVYQYLREDGTPYYIGKGKGNRAHYKGKHERIRKPIDKSRIVIIESGLLESEAIDLEIKLIAKYGRKDIGTGILQNMTDGGDGVSGAKFGRPPEERILKIANANRGKKRTDEVKKKLSERRTGKTDSAETKAKKSQSARKSKTKEHTENIRKSKLGEKNPMFGKPSPNKGKPMSQEQKEKIRISVLKRLAEKQNRIQGDSMGNKYRTAHGKMIDIDNLRLINEKTIAIGNMKVNARGDQLGQGGKIIQTRNQVMSQQYNKLQTPVADGNAVSQVPNLAPDGESFDPPEEVIKPLEPKLRGNLADSIAKQATVTQETLDPDMYKQKGPKRI